MKMLKEIKKIFETRKNHMQHMLGNCSDEKKKLKIQGALEEIDFFIATLDHYHEYTVKEKLFSEHIEKHHGKAAIPKIMEKIRKEHEKKQLQKIKDKHQEEREQLEQERKDSRKNIKTEELDAELEIPVPGD